MNNMLFGGSFDPPHLGHITMAKNVLAQKLANQVWFVPCGNHPFTKNLSPAAHRLNMLRLLKIPHTKIQDHELNKTSKSYSYQTLIYFKNKFPQHQFSWLLGSDQLADFDKWQDWQKLLQDFKVYIYPRNGYLATDILKKMVKIENVEPIHISSDQIRQKVKTGQSIKNLVLPEVEKYIYKHKLYN